MTSREKSQTNVERDAASPPLPKRAGVTITAANRTDARSALVVHGAFNLPHAEAETLGRPVHRAIALVIQRDDYHNVVMPFREYVLFADDEFPALQSGLGGYFHIDVFAMQGGAVPGDYHLSVSIGEQVSAVCEITVLP